MIPFGPFRPDAAAINAPVLIEARNVQPGVAGMLPQPSLVGGTPALPTTCRGAVSVLKDDGEVRTFAGTANKLFRLAADGSWLDVSGAEVIVDDSAVTITAPDGSNLTIAGDDYNVGEGEQWKFDLFGSLLIGTNVTNGPQKFNLSSSTEFAPLGGSPPAARYIAILRDFVVLGAIFENEKRVQWSSLNNAEGWTTGTGESDYQDFPNGGPVRGLIGGEVAYVFQATKVSRMTYQPGSSNIMQFDEIEGASGLAAPHSLVRLRADAFYLAPDGFRKFDLRSGSSTAIGTGKWVKWFLKDIKAGQEINVIGAADPVKPLILWAYVTKSNVSVTPNRVIVYDWSIDEAAYMDVDVETMLRWLSPGVTLDSMNSYGTLDTLPFSLDSPFWKGGASLMGIFGTDHRLSLPSGAPMEATLTTTDGQRQGRVLIKGIRPHIDTSAATVAVAARERLGDNVTFSPLEAMEETGVCSNHVSGNIARAKIVVPSGSEWSLCSGLETMIAGKRGKR